MSNYTKNTNFASKDTLPTGDTNKIVKGTEIDTEFNAIASAVASKADLASPTFTGTPAVPTATAGSNTTQIANTAFVRAELLAAPSFPSGTVMLFCQTSAPSGWTKDTTNFNNSALRVVTGSVVNGGSVDFTTAFTSQTPAGSITVNTSGLSAGATTLSTSQIPSHTHSYVQSTSSYSANADAFTPYTDVTTGTTGATGGGGSHTHTVVGTATASFTGTAINLAIKYVDVIRATKD